MGELNRQSWIKADWPAPPTIRAGTTTRESGTSLPPYAGLNLAQHVGDNAETVEQNRTLIQRQLGLPSSPLWLQQVHGNRIIQSENWSAGIAADGCYTRQEGLVCAVLSADCLPLLLCDGDGRGVAAIHLGWRGICAGLVDATIACFVTEPGKILAWIGPHIRADNYEVGEDVYQACVQALPGTDHAFTLLGNGKWLASLEELVRVQLLRHGISRIYGCDNCTFEDQTQFYSYRRQKVTGRTASLIWMETRARVC